MGTDEAKNEDAGHCHGQPNVAKGDGLQLNSSKINQYKKAIQLTMANIPVPIFDLRMCIIVCSDEVLSIVTFDLSLGSAALDDVLLVAAIVNEIRKCAIVFSTVS